LTTAGGTLALGLILAIALGINAMTLLFFGSAVVALERFARVATRRGVIAACVLVWAALLGAFSLYWNADALAGAGFAQWLRAFGLGSAWAALLVSGFVVSCRVGLRWIDPSRLGAAVLVVLGVATSLVLGASAQLSYAAAPAIVAAGAAGVLAAPCGAAAIRAASARSSGWSRCSRPRSRSARCSRSGCRTRTSSSPRPVR
jgi:hypothetical protein